MILLAGIFLGLFILAGCILASGGRLAMWPRVVIVVLLGWLAFGIWQAAQPPTGWPTPDKAPKDATFVWADVQEPDQLTHDSGRIILWVRPEGSRDPRAYQMPYSRRLHQQIAGAEQAARRGMAVHVHRARGGHQGPTQQGRFVFYREPPRLAPAKEK